MPQLSYFYGTGNGHTAIHLLQHPQLRQARWCSSYADQAGHRKLPGTIWTKLHHIAAVWLHAGSALQCFGHLQRSCHCCTEFSRDFNVIFLREASQTNMSIVLTNRNFELLPLNNHSTQFPCLKALIGNYAVPILEDKQVWGTSDNTKTAYLDTLVSTSLSLNAVSIK